MDGAVDDRDRDDPARHAGGAHRDCSTRCRCDAVNRYSKTAYPDGADAVLRVPRRPARPSVDGAGAAVQEIAAEHGGPAFQWATSPEERATAVAGAAQRALRRAGARGPARKAWTTDVCVPISRLAECIVETQADLRDAHARRAAGRPRRRRQLPPDLHARSRRPGGARSACSALNDRLVERALALGGTCTGEHGVGFGKMKYCRARARRRASSVMRAIKRALDPRGLMNPGKLVPES